MSTFDLLLVLLVPASGAGLLYIIARRYAPPPAAGRAHRCKWRVDWVAPPRHHYRGLCVSRCVCTGCGAVEFGLGDNPLAENWTLLSGSSPLIPSAPGSEPD